MLYLCDVCGQYREIEYTCLECKKKRHSLMKSHDNEEMIGKEEKNYEYITGNQG